MTAEINFTGTITVSPEDMTPLAQDIANVISMSGQNYVHNKQTIPGNVTTALDLGSVGTLGVGWFKNHDAVNFIDIYSGSGNAATNLLRILPGETWAIRMRPTAAPYALADTDDIVLEYLIAAQ